MAVLHISETEFAGDYASLLARARAGEDIVIDGATPLRLARELPSDAPIHVRYTQPRLITDVLAELQKRASTVTLPAGFGDDVEAAIQCHSHEYLTDPWE